MKRLICLLVIVNVVLLVMIVVKLGKSCSGSAPAKAMDYPTESCAYNCPTEYGDPLSPEDCASECNTTPSDCCNSVCDYDTTTKKFGNCNPPDGVHCGAVNCN